MNFTVSHHGNRSSKIALAVHSMRVKFKLPVSIEWYHFFSATIKSFDYDLNNTNWTTITHRLLWARKISYTMQPKETNSNENTTIQNHKDMWQVALYTCDLFVFFSVNVKCNWQPFARTSDRFAWNFVWMSV